MGETEKPLQRDPIQDQSLYEAAWPESEGLSRHRCLIYDGAPSVHLPLIASVIKERLQDNYRCLYLNSPAMIAGLRAYLAARGIDVVQNVARGSLVLSSDHDHIIDGEFSIDTILTNLGRLAGEALADGYQGLFASGDMLWEFGNERNLEKLLAYETRLEELLRTLPALSGICQYHREILPSSAVKTALYTHQTIYLNETLPRLNPHYRHPGTLRAATPESELSITAMLASLR